MHIRGIMESTSNVVIEFCSFVSRNLPRRFAETWMYYTKQITAFRLIVRFASGSSLASWRACRALGFRKPISKMPTSWIDLLSNYFKSIQIHSFSRLSDSHDPQFVGRDSSVVQTWARCSIVGSVSLSTSSLSSFRSSRVLVDQQRSSPQIIQSVTTPYCLRFSLDDSVFIPESRNIAFPTRELLDDCPRWLPMQRVECKSCEHFIAETGALLNSTSRMWIVGYPDILWLSDFVCLCDEYFHCLLSMTWLKAEFSTLNIVRCRRVIRISQHATNNRASVEHLHWQRKYYRIQRKAGEFTSLFSEASDSTRTLSISRVRSASEKQWIILPFPQSSSNRESFSTEFHRQWSTKEPLMCSFTCNECFFREREFGGRRRKVKPLRCRCQQVGQLFVLRIAKLDRSQEASLFVRSAMV